MHDNCKHNVWIEKSDDGVRHVFLANDDDPYFIQRFSDSEDLLRFIGVLFEAHNEAFVVPDTVERILLQAGRSVLFARGVKNDGR